MDAGVVTEKYVKDILIISSLQFVDPFILTEAQTKTSMVLSVDSQVYELNKISYIQSRLSSESEHSMAA